MTEHMTVYLVPLFVFIVAVSRCAYWLTRIEHIFLLISKLLLALLNYCVSFNLKLTRVCPKNSVKTTLTKSSLFLQATKLARMQAHNPPPLILLGIFCQY